MRQRVRTSHRIGCFARLQQTGNETRPSPATLDAETGQPVWLPLPGKIATELEQLAAEGDHFLWSGKGLPKSTVADRQ
jgi:hypothetical protein